STNFSRRATNALSSRSAICPPRAERKKNGAMKMAPASVTSQFGPPSWNRIRKTSAVLRKLSLKAEKNWHQNRGAKRRDSIRDPMTQPIGGIAGADKQKGGPRAALSHLPLILMPSGGIPFLSLPEA